MQTRQSRENLQRTFHTDLKGIFITAGFRKSFFSYWTTRVPAVLSALILTLVFLLKVDAYLFINELKDQMIEFLPGILGFTIAGYSLMVGFIQAGVLDKITEPMKDSDYSLYQSMSATFAINILLQAFALCIAYLVHYVIFFDVSRNSDFPIPGTVVTVINSATILILSYWFLVSLFMVIQIVINIFSFSQLHHYFVNKEKVDKAEQNKNGNG